MPLLHKNNILDEPDLASIRLVGNRVLVRMLRKSRFKGRFFLPEPEMDHRESPIGRVELVGDRYAGTPLEPGQYIIVASWVGREFPCPNEDLILLEPKDIVARIEK